MALQRVAVVTGSGKRRVGWHVADALARRGHALVLHYRSSAAEAEESVTQFRAAGVAVIAHQADLTQDDAARQLIEAALHHFGRVDVLANCAAVWPSKRLENLTASDVRRTFEANTLSTFLCAQQAGLAMVRQEEGGCIVNFGDWADARPYRDHAAYFISKAAIPGLTRCLAVELGGRNPRVRVNCVLPGPVMMPADLPETERREAIEGTLVKREGSPENVARAVMALVENDFITGACLPVDGGRTIYAPGQ